MRRTFRQFLTIVSTTAALPALVLAQGTITGRVTDAAAQRPLSDVQVRVVGTPRGALTDANGVYTIPGVPAGNVQVRAQRIGYAPGNQTVSVSNNTTATANFTLATAATALEQVVVTATGETQRKRETPHTVATVNVDSIDKAAVANFSQLLSSRAPGVTVQEAGGTTGSGSRVRIRGSNSVSLSNDPLIIIDGVRVNNASTGSAANTIGVGGQVPSRFNDINPEDIENIEILKGPSGVSLYGTAGANGVIQITTKRGRAGRTNWTAFAEGGTLNNHYDWPGNYNVKGFTAVGGVATTTRTSQCTLYNVAQGNCVQDSVFTFNPLVQYSPFRDGNRMQYGLSTSGGTQGTTFYIAGEGENEQGIYDVSQLRRANARANVNAQVRPNLTIAVNSGYTSSDLRLPQNDNNLFGAISGGLLGSAVDDPVGHGYASGMTSQTIYAGFNTRQNIERFTGGVNANWTALKWLSATGQFGADIVNRHDNETSPPNIITTSAAGLEGYRTSNRYQIREYTANGNLSAQKDVTSDLISTTSAGVQYNDQRLAGNRAFGAKLLAGTESLNGTVARFSVTEENQEVVTVGFYGQEQVAWRDRLFANVALRADNNSAFGTNAGYTYYPAAGLSWVVSEEPFFPRIPQVGSIRVRASYGESGQRPGFRQAQQFFSPVAVNVKGVEVPAFTVGGVGNVNLKPEKSREYEGGLDLNDLFGSKASLELTYYNKTTNQALVFIRTAPSLGVSQTQPQNLGQVKNDGFEALLTARPVDNQYVAWDLTVSASRNNNKLVRLGTDPADTNPIIFGLGGASQRHAQGYPLGSYFLRKYTYNDANNDGLIAPSEITFDAQPSYLGNPLPKTEISLNTAMTFWKYAKVSANFDHRGGMKLYNSTTQFRCASAFVNCEQAFIKGKSDLAFQAGIAASRLGSDAYFIEDATFTKLRELSLSLTAPKSLASQLRVSGATLTFSGRNLATWTDYTGFDPEVNFTADNYSTADFLSQPPVRYYIARLTLTF